MATAEFDAQFVADCCVAAIAQQENDMAAANERGIVELMERPVAGYWPWSKTTKRTRAEAEEHYGKVGNWHSARWWTESVYRGRIAQITAVRKLAEARHNGTIRLDDKEARLVCVA